MTDSTRRRRRKRAESQPEVLRPSLPVEESSESSTGTDSTRRRRRTKAGSQPEVLRLSLPVEEKSEGITSEDLSERQVALDLPKQTELTDEVGQWVGRKEISGIKTGLDEISAELEEERASTLVESDYWDETHSWGVDDEEASDEYWHFVGRYE